MDRNDHNATRHFGETVRFGRAAEDYARHRSGPPETLFKRLAGLGWIAPGQRALDLGTGTGAMAAGLARAGLRVTGVDPDADLLVQARVLHAGLDVDWRVGRAEQTGQSAGATDLVSALQCWHWFDRPRAADEIVRVLRPGGRLIIAHFDWLPLPGNVVAMTEAMIMDANPNWRMGGGTGLYPAWLADMGGAGFTGIETFSFDHAQSYSHAAWRGRIRASAGIGGSLDPASVAAFDGALARRLASDFPEDPLAVPHRVWVATGVVAADRSD